MGAILPLETGTAIPRSRYVRQNEGMCPSQFNVDLAAIDANLALASERNPGRAVLLPVKANAYGHGIVPVARHVESVGSAQWLGVAEVSGAEQRREGGEEAEGEEILIFSGKHFRHGYDGLFWSTFR